MTKCALSCHLHIIEKNILEATLVVVSIKELINTVVLR
jgi:hypothetical protein